VRYAKPVNSTTTRMIDLTAGMMTRLIQSMPRILFQVEC
jgi:hypothetical protein